jgi:REP element-mobilizing transposase RayT
MPVFRSPQDYLAFLTILANNKRKYCLKIHHFVLMPNHFHLVMSLDDGCMLGKAMKRINLMYVQYYRRRYGGIGHFFQDRFKSHLIERGVYLERCAQYVEMNPVRAGLADEPGCYFWSSANDAIGNLFFGLLDRDPSCLTDDIEEIGIGLERRSIERYFRAGLWGSAEYQAFLVSVRGLRPRWSHRGRPGKSW